MSTGVCVCIIPRKNMNVVRFNRVKIVTLSWNHKYWVSKLSLNLKPYLRLSKFRQGKINVKCQNQKHHRRKNQNRFYFEGQRRQRLFNFCFRKAHNCNFVDLVVVFIALINQAKSVESRKKNFMKTQVSEEAFNWLKQIIEPFECDLVVVRFNF